MAKSVASDVVVAFEMFLGIYKNINTNTRIKKKINMFNQQHKDLVFGYFKNMTFKNCLFKLIHAENGRYRPIPTDIGRYKLILTDTNRYRRYRVVSELSRGDDGRYRSDTADTDLIRPIQPTMLESALFGDLQFCVML